MIDTDHATARFPTGSRTVTRRNVPGRRHAEAVRPATKVEDRTTSSGVNTT